MDISTIIDKLAKMDICNVLTNEPLSKHTSIKIGGCANLFVNINSISKLKKCIDFLHKNKIKYFILGNGTNTLCSDNGFDGVVVCLGGQLKNFRLEDDGIFAEAGMNLFELNKICRKFGLSGLEFSYGIPGSVGGAIVMNAGAFEHSVGDFVDYCILIKDGDLVKFGKDEMNFAYRTSIAQSDNLIIVGAKFKLSKQDSRQIETLQNEYFQKKLSAQPYSDLSFGSTFKRNLNFEPVSKIIDCLGLKGYAVGGIAVSEKHAGFIVNKHHGTCKDCLKLIKYIREQVYAKYGFKPELEVKLLGVKQSDETIW